MHDLRVLAALGLKTVSSEHFTHRGVVGEHIGDELTKSCGLRDGNEVTREKRADALSLEGVDHDEGHLGQSGLGDYVAATADDRLCAVLLDHSDQRSMIDEVDVHEE